MADLSEFERKTLEILRDKGPCSYTSQVGELLLRATEGADRKSRPSRQGLALFAGRFLGKLQRRGLVNGYRGWGITQQGKDLLATLEGQQGDLLQVGTDEKN